MSERQTFPILGASGARIDLQLVIDHGRQAARNHNQSVSRLAERGGLSWCELHAVLHDKRYQKMDTNEAMLACRALEARYLQAVCADLPPTLSAAMGLPEVRALVEATSALIGVLEIASVLPTAIQKIYTPRMDAPELVQARAALAAIKETKT